MTDAQTEYEHRLRHADDNLIKKLRSENARLRDALRPFAEFNDALKEWRCGRGHWLQDSWPEHKPVLRWVEPTPPPWMGYPVAQTVRHLRVWSRDFARAEQVLSDVT